SRRFTLRSATHAAEGISVPAGPGVPALRGGRWELSRSQRNHLCGWTEMSTCVGGGKGAHAEDTFLADSLKRALGPDYDVRYPRMPGESNPGVELWGQEISSELSKISGKVILVAHSVGGSILLQYLSDEKFGDSIGGL